MTLRGNRGFVEVIMDPEMGDDSGWSGWARCHHEVLVKGRQEVGVREGLEIATLLTSKVEKEVRAEECRQP